MLEAFSDQKLPDDGVIKLDFFRHADAVALFKLDSDAEHRRRFQFPKDFTPSLGYSEQVIMDWTRARETGERHAFAVRDLSTGELLGGCELRPVDPLAADLSYWTLPGHRLRGVASRAAALACEAAASLLGLKQIRIIVDTDNQPSRRVAVRNGFVESGTRSGQVVYLKDL